MTTLETAPEINTTPEITFKTTPEINKNVDTLVTTLGFSPQPQHDESSSDEEPLPPLKRQRTPTILEQIQDILNEKRDDDARIVEIRNLLNISMDTSSG
jgi:hypothetical protein